MLRHCSVPSTVTANTAAVGMPSIRLEHIRNAPRSWQIISAVCPRGYLRGRIHPAISRRVLAVVGLHHGSQRMADPPWRVHVLMNFTGSFCRGAARGVSHAPRVCIAAVTQIAVVLLECMYAGRVALVRALRYG